MMKKNLFENKIIIKRTDHRHDLLYKLLNETLYNSTAQIILKIFKTEYILLKIMLAISVVGSIALCSYLIIQSIFNYLSYEVNTKIRKVEETPTVFPQVTICSRNAFTTYDGFEFLKNVSDIFSNPPFKNDDVANAVNFASIKAFSISNDERRKFGFSIQDLLVECKYDYLDCTFEEFVPKYDKFHGNCFIFNSGYNLSNQKVDLKTSSFVGKKGGLTVTLKVKLDQNLKDVYSDNGYTIRIDNSSYVFGSDDWIDLLTGFETNVIVDRYYTYQLPTPYSRCIVQNDTQYDSELFKLFYNSNLTYKQEQCYDLCYQKLVIAECNCTDFESFSLFDVEPCGIEKTNCSNDVYHYKFHLDNYINGKCLPMCPLECSQTEYKSRVSYSQELSKLLSKFSNDTETVNLVKLNVYYDTLSYTVLTESINMDVVALLSSIGGSLGLLLGLSLLSFIEVLEVVVETMFIYYKNENKIESFMR